MTHIWWFHSTVFYKEYFLSLINFVHVFFWNFYNGAIYAYLTTRTFFVFLVIFFFFLSVARLSIRIWSLLVFSLFSKFRVRSLDSPNPRTVSDLKLERTSLAESYFWRMIQNDVIHSKWPNNQNIEALQFRMIPQCDDSLFGRIPTHWLRLMSHKRLNSRRFWKIFYFIERIFFVHLSFRNS